MRDAPGERPGWRPGKGSIEIASVGKIAVAVQEAVHVDNRHGDDGARKRQSSDMIEDAPNDLDAGDFVAVYRSAQPDGWPVVSAVDHA